MKIGIDIGGTHTDGVLVDAHQNIVSSVKVPTRVCLNEGFQEALAKLLETGPQLKGVFVGTTHATNAILQCQDLHPVGVLRLAGHEPQTLPPAYGWPTTLRQTVLIATATVGGGYECDGRPLTPLIQEQVLNAVEKLLEQGAASLAVTGVFSPLYDAQEQEVARWIQERFGEIPVSLSHRVGTMGFIERENVAILNAALKKVMANGFAQLMQSCQTLGIRCPMYVSQNNGSTISLQQALDYPVLTLSAGPTNSFIGAAKLAGLKDALVVDIGGTSTDIGLVLNGYPRSCLRNSTIGGVSLNFPLPDVLSIALGGGSHVQINDDRVIVGPKSCAKSLFQESISFGGTQLTLTDIAIALGQIAPSGAHVDRVKMEPDRAMKVMDQVRDRLAALVRRMEADQSHLPIILVGGGASLLPRDHLSNRYQIPRYFEVANAYGAALGEISSTVDTVVVLSEREKMLDVLKQKALQNAVKAGACPQSVRVVDVQIIPYHYMPGSQARVVVRASGVALH